MMVLPHQGMDREARMIRVLLAAGAVIDLLFGVLHHRLDDGTGSPWWPRLLVCAACLAALGATYVPAWREHALDGGVAGILFLVTGSTLYRAWSNGFAPRYAMGLLTAAAIGTIGMRRRGLLATYWAITLPVVVLAIVTVPSSAVPRSILLACYVTIGVLCGMLHWSRMGISRLFDERELLHRMLVAESTEAIGIIDPIDRRLLELNPSGRSLLGVPGEGDSGEWGGALLGQRDLIALDVVLMMKEIAEHGRFLRERAFLRPDGTAWWGRVTVRAVAQGGRRYLLARVSDVSERREAEGRLADSEERLRLVLAKSADVLARWSAEGRWLALSGAVAGLLGGEADAFIGEPVRDRVVGDDQIAFDGLLGRALASGEPQAGRVRVRRAGRADPVWIEVAVRLVGVPGSAGKEIVAVLRDITERVALESGMGQGA